MPHVFPLVAMLAWSLFPAAAAATFEGQVVEDHTGSPLSTASVRIRKAAGRTVAADLETNGEGRFQAPALAAGDYLLEVSKSNYLDTTLRLHVDSTASSPVLVRLVRCGVITGQVADQEGRPVRGARVYAVPKPADGLPLRPFSGFRSGSYTDLDERGRFRLYNLPPGQYAVVASYGAPTGFMARARRAPTRLGSGVLSYPNNAQPQFFTVSGGEEFHDVDFTIPLSTSYSVGGKVTPPSSIGRFWLALANVEQPSMAAAVVMAAEDGGFHFDGIAPGSYHLFASGPSLAQGYRGGILGAQPLFGRTRVEVGGQSVEDVSLTVEPGRSISLLLRPPASGGACPSSAQVILSSLDDWGSTVESKVEVASAQPRTVENLAPARYQLAVANLGEDCYSLSDAVLDLTIGLASQPLPIQTTPAGSLRGRLTETANPTGFAVVLVSTDPTAGAPVQVMFPDAAGQFAFGSLRPGRYRVAAQPAAGAGRARWVADRGTMFEIDIPGGTPTEMDLPAPAPEKPAP